MKNCFRIDFSRFSNQVFVGIGAFALSLGVLGCKTPEDNRSEQRNAKPQTQGPSLVIPKAGSINNRISKEDKQAILNAWRNVRDTYYDRNDWKFDIPNVNNVKYDFSEAERCINACPDYYGPLVCHFYCWHPSYSLVSPNVRGCVTNIARGSVTKSNGDPLFYPEIYDYCVYQDYDVLKNKGNFPQFDPPEIERNRKSGDKPGVLKWVDDNEGDVFRYIMFTHYEPYTYSYEDQNEIINEFYEVKNPNSSVSCQKRPPMLSDPSTDTYCSNTDETKATFNSHPDKATHQKFADIYLRAHYADYYEPTVGSQPTPPSPGTLPDLSPIVLNEGTYLAKSDPNCDLEISDVQTTKKKKIEYMTDVTIKFTNGCVLIDGGKELSRSRKFQFIDCGADGECDANIDQDNNIEIKATMKSKDSFTLRYFNKKGKKFKQRTYKRKP